VESAARKKLMEVKFYSEGCESQKTLGLVVLSPDVIQVMPSSTSSSTHTFPRVYLVECHCPEIRDIDESTATHVKVTLWRRDAFYLEFGEHQYDVNIARLKTWARTHGIAYRERLLPHPKLKPDTFMRMSSSIETEEICSPSQSNKYADGAASIPLPNLDDPAVRQHVLQLLFSDSFRAYVHDMQGLVEGMGWKISLAKDGTTIKAKEEEKGEKKESIALEAGPLRSDSPCSIEFSDIE